MSEVVIDGRRYIPETTGNPVIGIAVMTHNRPKVLAKTLAQHRQHLPPGAILVVVDDGSKPPAADADFRFEQSRGIVAAGNKALELLMDAGAQELFVWNDDAYPIADGWERPYIASDEPHLMYQFLDLAGPNKLRDIAVVYQDEQHIAYTGARGVMLYFNRSVIEKVGGFDPVYGRGLYEHGDLSNRIHHAGLTSWRFADVRGSGELIYSLDEHEQVQRTMADRDRQQTLAQNAHVYNSRRETRHTGYIEFREPHNVVFTCLYAAKPDPQRPAQRMNAGMLQPLIESVTGADVIVQTDTDQPIRGAETVHASATENVFFQRQLDAFRWLRAHPEVRWVLCCDGTDVIMQHEPWSYLEPGKLYLGSEPAVLANEWLIRNHPAPDVQAFITDHPHLQLLNAGVIMGDRATVMSFLHELVRWYFDRKANRFHKKDTAGDDLGDMGALNLIAHSRFADRLVWGSAVTTVFRQNETNGWSWIKHK